MRGEKSLKIASYNTERSFKDIARVNQAEKIKDYDFLISDKADQDLDFYKGFKIYIGSISSLSLKELGFHHYLPKSVTETQIIEFCQKQYLKKAHVGLKINFAQKNSDESLLKEELERLRKENLERKNKALNTKGLSDYVLRLLSVNTIEQLVYETESLRILKFKGIRVSLIYLDGEGGYLSTKNSSRKIKGLEKIIEGGRATPKRNDLASILSRPVLTNFKIYSEKINDKEHVVALFESQKDFLEEDSFLEILKKLLFSNFVRVLQSEKLLKNSALLSKAFNQIPNTALLISPDYTIRVSNRKESIGKKCFSYMFSKDSPCTGCPVLDLENAKEKYDFYGKGYVLEDSGQVVYSSSVKSQSKNFYLHIYESLEKSQKRESIQIQRGKLKSIGLVAQALTHELNNPLTGIHELSTLMSEGYEGQAREDLEDISKASRRCIDIIESLKKFSSKKIEFERLELSKVLKETLILTKVLTRRVRLEIDVEEGLWISASRTLLIQAIFNIIKNSVEAIPETGTISIRLHRVKDQVVLLFEDNGPGLPLDMEKVSLFGTKNKKKGTGFGLFLVNEFMKLHKGKLDFGNRNGEGQSGAYFKLSFPLSRGA